MKKLEIFVLGLIIILATTLRFYKITTNPPSLYWDEVSIGYNANSILQTGKDEWGQSYPLLFKSFGDYKLPLYIYAVTISEKFLGPTELAVRLPSALAGILTVTLVFFLLHEEKFLILERFPKLTMLKNNIFPFFGSLFLAISPWHLQFSRAGFEANTSLLFTTATVLFFLLAMRKNTWFLLAAVISLVACFYTYHSAAITTPIVVLVLLVLFYKKLWSQKKVVLVATVLAGLLLLPYLPSYILSAHGRVRFADVSVAHQQGNLITNVVNNYVANFSTDYLFFKGDQEGRHSVKKLGELYLWQLPAVLAGLYFLLRFRSKASAITLTWLLISALPPAITRVSPHALRGLMTVRSWQTVTAIGLLFLLIKLKPLWRYLFIIIFAFGLITYLHQYYVHYPVSFAADWQDGQKQAITYLKSVEKNYPEIFLTRDLYPIYFQFYFPYDPAILQKNGHQEEQMGKFKYVSLLEASKKQFPGQKALVLAPSWMGSDVMRELPPIKMSNDDIAFRVYEY